MPCLGQQRLEGYPRTEAGAPSRAPASGREITRSKPFFPAPFPAPCSKTLQEVVLGLAGKQPLEVFLAFRAGENFPSLSTSCLRMKNTAHSFILRQENPPIHGNTCLKMEKPTTFFILRHKNESGRVFLSAGSGAAELVERSWRKRRSFLPAALRGALGKALLASPRKTSCTEATPAAVEMSLSPARIAA